MNRLLTSDAALRAAEMTELRAAAQVREREILELTRRLQHRPSRSAASSQTFDIEQLQAALGTHTALVEYLWLGAECLAFIVTGDEVVVVRELCAEAQVRGWLERFRWQNRTLRYGRDEIQRHLPQLNQRAQAVLSTLHQLLLAPLEPHLGTRRLVIVPHGLLHYVPFHALYDGTQYALERREISYAPSAKVLLHCLATPSRPLTKGVFVGVPDARTPSVRDEAQSLAQLFDAPTVLLDQAATPAAVAAHAPEADLLHFACHAGFRPDSPLFSALHLADGNLTVRDVAQWRLKCGLVTLSACETGLSQVAPGDELTGLARGFFAAGAPSLVLSLWAVDDIATTELMGRFYMRLQSGDTPAKALRKAQLAMLAAYQHPYYWSPFVLTGRW
jgi:CHAT domain-containing protein